MSSHHTPVPKRIVICCDGTWQSSIPGEANIFPSNIARLSRNIERTGVDAEKRVWQQIVYYDSGTGDGLAATVIKAYNFIVLNYSPGDEIFCFGFSRGAYTARAVAGLVTDIGVIQVQDMQVFPRVYEIYRKNILEKKKGESAQIEQPFRLSKGWKEFVEGKKSEHPDAIKLQKEIEQTRRGMTDDEKRIYWDIPPCGELVVSEESRKVKVVGVWDTVGSLGIPDGRWKTDSLSRAKYGLHNVKLSSYIENAFQALALDEHRKAFSPTLWYIPKDRLSKGRTPNLMQVWFPGVHINIGGGSGDTLGGKEDLEQMANVTLAWMVECLRPYLAINETTLNQSVVEYTKLLADLDFKTKRTQQTGVVQRLYNGIYSYVPFFGSAAENTSPEFKGGSTARFHDNYEDFSGYPGESPRMPGEGKTETGFDGETVIEKNLKELGDTKEMIHPIVRLRREQTGDKSGCLSAWECRKSADKKKKGFEWFKGDIVLPEYVSKASGGPLVNIVKRSTLRLSKGSMSNFFSSKP